MIEMVIYVSAFILVLGSFVGLYRAYIGPSAADRMVAINMIATKTTAIIVLIALVSRQGSYVNVALMYAMIAFVATIGVAKYLMKGKLN